VRASLLQTAKSGSDAVCLCFFIRPIALLASIPAAALSWPLSAQEANPPPEVTELPEVTVSATATPEPLTEVGSSVTVIDSAQIEREQRRTVPDALSLTPGLNVVQTGGPGGVTSVFIRGTNSNQVKVLIDGIDASDPSNANGSFDFGQLLTYDIARIEVLCRAAKWPLWGRRHRRRHLDNDKRGRRTAQGQGADRGRLLRHAERELSYAFDRNSVEGQLWDRVQTADLESALC
jgi:hypothetical protein